MDTDLEWQEGAGAFAAPGRLSSVFIRVHLWLKGLFSMDDHRTARVSEAVREELSEIIGFEMDDPRLLAVGVSEVQVSPDSRHARIKVVVAEGPEAQQALAALDHARNYLRHELATRLGLRRVPELHFEMDRWAEVDNRIELLLKRAKKKRGPTENQG